MSTHTPLAVVALALLAFPGFAHGAPSQPPRPATAKQAPAPWVGAQLKGVEVISVATPSPAATAGLEVGDRIVSVDGLPTPSGEDVAAVIRDATVGAFVVMRVERGTRQLALAVFLAPRPGGVTYPPAAATPPPAPANDARRPPESADDGYEGGYEGGYEDDDAGATEPPDWSPGASYDDPLPPVPRDEGSPDGDAHLDPWRAGSPEPAPGHPGVDSPWGPPSRGVGPPSTPAPSTVRVGSVDLAHHRGDVVVLQFMATWCETCLATQPRLDGWQRRFGGSGLTVISASSEAPELLERYRDQHHVRGVIAHDRGDALAARHGVRTLPTIVVFDRDGRPRGRFVGAGSNLARIEALAQSLLSAPAGHSAPRPRTF